MIEGATRAEKQLEKAECSKHCWSRWDVIGLRQFYVDVCNKSGCRLSEKNVPKVLLPQVEEGQVWDALT